MKRGSGKRTEGWKKIDQREGEREAETREWR